MEPTKPKECPRCVAGAILPIAYGLPSAKGREAARRGAVHPGGCIPREENWHCVRCKHNWFVGADPLRVERR